VVIQLGGAQIATAQRGPQRAAASPRAGAPVDITGNWVSVVTEDWLQRMLMPPRGDYAGVPLSLEGRRVANLWEPAKSATDGCKPFGAPGIMRVPGRLRISWENDTTLKIETDAGQQTRLLHFDTSPAGSGSIVNAGRSTGSGSPRTKATDGKPSPREPSARTWQGYSAAEWDMLQQRGGQGAGLAPPAPRMGGSLKVVTTNLRAGYLRKNGVPYSEDTVVTEYFDRITEDNIDWLTVVTIVNDPTYLTQEFVTSTHFKRDTETSNWMPTPCEQSRAVR
jgi:hypothetical protein